MNQNLNALDDKELVSLYKSGNNDAFGILVERHAESVSYSLRNIFRDPLLIEDVIQDTFLNAMEAIKKDSYIDNGTFKAWLTRIGHNIAIDYYRTLKKHNVHYVPPLDNYSDDGSFFSSLIGDEKSPEEEIISMETDYDIQSLLDSLPAEQREVIVLRHFQNFRFSEIVDYIGGDISINTCLGRMRYGLINLKKMINEIKTEGRKVIQ